MYQIIVNVIIYLKTCTFTNILVLMKLHVRGIFTVSYTHLRQSPDIAVVTNVAPNHLDMHKDMQEYIDAKRNILLHQNAFSKTILNADNEITRSFASDVRGQTVWFSYHHPVEEGSFLDSEGYLCMAHNGEITRVLHKSEIRIPGEHNVENYLTAIAAAWGLVSPQTMAKVAKEFGGVEHRIEFVREIGGAKWYNDSIASSPTRTIAGLKSFPHRVIPVSYTHLTFFVYLSQLYY